MANMTWGVICLVVVVLAIAREVGSKRSIARLREQLSALEAQLAARNQLADVGQLVSGIAQELKSPLQGVIGNTELMLASGGAGEAGVEELQNIRENATRAAGIVRNLLAFTETSITRRWQDINEVVSRACAGWQANRQASVPLEIDCAERLPVVYVDGRQLEHVIAAFLDRSELSGALGISRIKVSTGLAEPGGERLLIQIDEDTAAVSDRDAAVWSGDLAVCHRVIEAHGGSITVETRNEGVRIRLELPTSASGF
jgi:signal transduction histidine kinase